MEQLTDRAQYSDIVERYRRLGCLSNDYLQTRADELVDSGLLYADCHEHNAYLLERKPTCLRLYFYLNDLTAVDAVSTTGEAVATEILYRGADHFPAAERDYLLKLGFSENLVRDQYAAVYKDLEPAMSLGDVDVRPAISLDEVEWACVLFNGTFDPYSGDFISREQYNGLLSAGQILVAADKTGNLLGALHQTVERNVAWISHVAVVPEARGHHVGQALLNAFVECNHTSDKSRYMLWVQQQNAAAVAMYKKKGFRYLNKSTLSLIKQTTNFTNVTNNQ